MSRIKELKESPENNINIVNVLALIVPEYKNKTKYVETLLRIFHNDIKLQDKSFNERKVTFNLPEAEIANLNKLEKIYLTILLNEQENRDAFKKFVEFCEFNEKNAIENNDLQTYKSFSDVFKEHGKAKEKEEQKLLEKQVIKLLDDENWFAVIPLTYEASLKYGATTKWCTASSDYPTHYDNYTKKGVLIYTVNKKTKKKYAGYCEIKSSSKEITFWDQQDNKVDGFSCGFSAELYQVFSEQFKITDPSNIKIDTIEVLRKNNLGTKKPSLPNPPVKKTNPIEEALGMAAGGSAGAAGENADYTDIYNTIINYMGGRR